MRMFGGDEMYGDHAGMGRGMAGMPHDAASGLAAPADPYFNDARKKKLAGAIGDVGQLFGGGQQMPQPMQLQPGMIDNPRPQMEMPSLAPMYQDVFRKKMMGGGGGMY